MNNSVGQRFDFNCNFLKSVLNIQNVLKEVN